MTSLWLPALTTLQVHRFLGLGGRQSLGCSPPPAGPAHPTIQFLAQSQARLFCYKEGWFGVTNTHKQRCDTEPLVASLSMKKLRHREAGSYPGSHSYEGAELGSTPLSVPFRGCAGSNHRTPRPPPQAGAGQGKQEAGRGSWLSSPHLTTSRALRPPEEKTSEEPSGTQRGWGPSWNSSRLADPNS